MLTTIPRFDFATMAARLRQHVNTPTLPARLNLQPIARPQRGPLPAKAGQAKRSGEFDRWTERDDNRANPKTWVLGPVCVVRFADGVTIRMSSGHPPGKTPNAGRGLRVCVAAWQARRKLNIPPAVEAMHFERDGKVIARFRPQDANAAMVRMAF